MTAGDDDQITAEHRKLVSLIDKAVKRGALHANTGARKKSRAERMRSQRPRRLSTTFRLITDRSRRRPATPAFCV